MALYESEHTRWMREWMDKHPEERLAQRTGRALWWDKPPCDEEEQRLSPSPGARKRLISTSTGGGAGVRGGGWPARLLQAVFDNRKPDCRQVGDIYRSRMRGCASVRESKRLSRADLEHFGIIVHPGRDCRVVRTRLLPWPVSRHMPWAKRPHDHHRRDGGEAR
jgi:hypothetical protein